MTSSPLGARSIIPLAPRPADGSPLSLLQERLWVLHQMNPANTSWNLPFAFMVEGTLNLSALASSLTEILRRHENLRMRFPVRSDGTPLQIASPPEELVLEIVDASEDQVAGLVAANAQHHFDLETGPVFVHKLVRLGPLKHLLLLNMHHIVADGWSIEGIFFAELQTCFEVFSQGRPANLRHLPIQYADFAVWQRKQDLSKHLAYWRESLSGYEGSLELPTDYARGPGSGMHSATFQHSYTAHFCRDLDNFSRRHDATLFMSIMAGFALLVHRYTGQEDLCLGTTSSGRPMPELEGLIGFFINILPLRIQVDARLSVAEFMAQVRASIVAGFDHQAAPFERILQSLDVSQKTKGATLVPLIVRHQNFPRTNMNKVLPGGARFTPHKSTANRDDVADPASISAEARCEMEMSYTGGSDGLSVNAVYASDLFRQDSVKRLLTHHEQLMRSMFENDSLAVGELTMMSPDEIKRVTVEGNRSWAGSENLATFVERFVQQLERSPEQIACIDASGETTYRQLAQTSYRLADALRERGVERGELVGICLERGVLLLSSILAVWFTGAAYVPIDPAYPEAYRDQILSDAKTRLVLGTSATLAGQALPASQRFALDETAAILSSFPATIPEIIYDAESLAYVMYTSGSTGKPKGVRVPHRQLINWLGVIENNWPFSASDVVGQKTTCAFAPSVKELFAGLLSGVPQVFLDSATVLNTPALLAALDLHKVTRLNLVPSHLEGLMTRMELDQSSLPHLRMCITAGEPLSGELVGKFRTHFPHARLINNYGCTELNDITYFDTAQFNGSHEFVPVGRPIANTAIFLLDSAGRLVPDGLPGQLHVSTVGMPESYHCLPELDATQFSANPFGDGFSERLFNTGDLARRLACGEIEFIGRRDFQVKVRGQRVDVRHVEKVLGDFSGIGPRAVVSDGIQLTAYFVPLAGAAIDVEALRQFLSRMLPGFMVPSAFISLEAMPRLPNGKFDRRALIPTAGQISQSRAFQAPANRIENTIASIWADVLRFSLEEIGKNTHFFEIGGDSLAAARVMGHLHERLGAEVGMSILFDYPRLAELAERVKKECPDLQVSNNDDSATDLASDTSPRTNAGILQGKVVLITGASRGIGSTAARALAQQGACVALNYRKSEARATRVKEIIQSEGGTAAIFQADVTNQDQVNAMVADVIAKFGRIDVLVSNAAIGFKMQSFLDHEWSDFQRKVNDELAQLFFLCKAVVPDMASRGEGSIVSVSSTMSKAHGEGFIAHSAGKAALDAFVRSLSSELGPQGIRVNTVAPGLIITDATANLPPAVKESAAAWSPLRRNGVAQDVAGSILFYASDLSRYITGSYQAVDGGMTML